MGIFKKIWNWLSQDVTKDFQKSDEDYMLKNTTYNTGGYIKNAERYVAPSNSSNYDSGSYSSSSDSGSSSSSCDSGC